MSPAPDEPAPAPDDDPGAAGPLASGPAEAPQRRLQAAALHYEQGDNAPRVVASGSGHLAQRIIEAAQEAGVPIRSDPALAQALAALELGEEIPQALYRAVAETLAWAYRLDSAQADG